MEWQFRKALESLEAYKKISTVKNDIESGDENVLNRVVRQIDLILADNNERIISKVLSLRFIRDIMIFGKEQIVRKVEKLLPHYIKVCSYECQSDNPDRGETYFHYHQEYAKTNDQQIKQQIDRLGSTFLILSLESIYHWAQWIPTDLNGQESIYRKSYQSLIDRGVKFPTNFHYYKQSDTQKFKNMYKIEFFTDSFESYTQIHSFGVRSDVNLSENKLRKTSKIEQHLVEESIKNDQYTGEQIQLKNLNDIKAYLTELKRKKLSKIKPLKQINKKIQSIYQQNSQKRLALSKQQKRWSQNYLVNFNLFEGNQLDYNEFLNKVLSEQVFIQNLQQEYINSKKQIKGVGIKSKAPNGNGKVQKVRSESQQKNGQQDSQLFNKSYISNQSNEKNRDAPKNYKQNPNKRDIVGGELQNQAKFLKRIHSNSEKVNNSFENDVKLQNTRLKDKIIQLQQELASLNYNKQHQKEIQTERNHLLTKYKRLEIQHEKVLNSLSKDMDTNNERVNLELLVKEKQEVINKLSSDLRKSEKVISNYEKQIQIYKAQLTNQKMKLQPKLQNFKKISESLQNQNNSLKDKAIALKKQLQSKQFQILKLTQLQKSNQAKIKQYSQKLSSLSGVQERQQKTKANNLPQQLLPNKISTDLRFHNYSDLYSELKPSNKQMFLRLCKCGLKKKEILFKDSDLQIGIITEIVDQDRIRFILHFTNLSQHQIDNLKIYQKSYSNTDKFSYLINNNFIFCIHPQQQQKSTITITNSESPYIKQRVIIQISYQKYGERFNNVLILPFFITKFYDFEKPKGSIPPANALSETLQIRYAKKMLPKASAIQNYFQQAQQLTKQTFELDAYHRETDLSVRVRIHLRPQKQIMVIEAQVLRAKINQKQKYSFEQLLSFLQIAFKK